MKLSDYPLEQPTRVAATTPASEARSIMRSRGTNILVVCNCGPNDPIGWISEAHLAAAIEAWPEQVESIPVQSLMVPQIDACYINQPVEVARSVLRHRQSPILAVFDPEERFVGVIRRVQLSEIETT